MYAFSARAFWLPVLLLTLVAAFFGAILGRQARAIEVSLAWQVRLERDLAEAKAADRRMIAERNALLSSPEAIERVAREELGFVAPGERVTAFETVSSARPAPFVSSVRLTRLERLLLWPRLPLALPAAVFLGSAVLFGACNLAFGVGRPETAEDAAAEDDAFEVGLPA